MRLPLLTLLASALLFGRCAASEEDDDADYSGEEDGDEGEEAIVEEEATRQSVYVMEHGFLSGEAPSWTPRCTLLLTGAPGRGYEARLSDAKEFVEMKPELQPLMSAAAAKNRYYAIRMYSPEQPKRILQASIPAKLLADHFEDWHDILEVSVGATGAPVSLSYRVRNTLGLALFDHTQVHISEPSHSDGPRVNIKTKPKVGPGGKVMEKEEPPSGPMGLMRKYWWVGMIVLLLVSNLSGDEPAAAGGKARGGGGGK